MFCSGHVYYELTTAERPANVAIIRVEELAPWPREIGELVDQYPNVEEVVWAQEEPKNMGALDLRAAAPARVDRHADDAPVHRAAGAGESGRGVSRRRTTLNRRASSRMR